MTVHDGVFEQSIPDRFRAQVRSSPRRPAIAADDVELTYEALDCATNSVAQSILRRVGGDGHRIVLLAEQGAAACAATLGILKAGAAYVPLDPDLTSATLRRTIELVEPALIVADRRHYDAARRLLPDLVQVVCIEDAWAQTGAADPRLDIAPDALACIYFTSGSTGEPKGVCDAHRNVLHNVWRYTTSLAIAPSDRLTLLQAPHFSGAASSLFCALLNGASTHPYEVRSRGIAGIGPWLRAHAITIYHSVPTLFRAVFAGGGFPALRCVRLEGDRASRRDVEIFRASCAPGTVLANGLGCTECGLVRQWRIDHTTPVPEGPVPIGHAIPDMEVLVLGEDGAEVSRGEVGEIAVRSRYLAHGYWRQPALAAARFSSDVADPALRIYRTGDLGRMQDDGLLLHLGRMDGNARVDGQWIDLDAVERELNGIPQVREAVASMVQLGNGESRLAAYVVLRPDEALDVAAFRQRLAERLPRAMVPVIWSAVDRIPLGANLKIDRTALPPPDIRRRRASPDLPIPPLEATLQQLWRDVLGVEDVGVHEDFFALGGDSIAMMKLGNRLAGTLSIELPATVLFTHPTIAQLAAELERMAGRGS